MSQNPHDQLFKKTFSEIENARGFLKVSFPHEISKRIDWNDLKLQSGSFVDEKLHETHSDLLFESKIGRKKCFIYILAEHKSENDPWVLFQLLQYQVSIWKRFRKEYPKNKSLPPIIPLVVSHAKKGWRASKQFSDLFHLDEELRSSLKKYLLGFECTVQDLTHQQELSIRKWSEVNVFARLTLLLLKSTRDSTPPLEMFEQWVEILQEIERFPDAKDRFSLVFSYVYKVKKISTQEEKKLIGWMNQKVGAHAKEAVMTGAERLRAEGIQKGRAEGIQKGRAEGIQKGRAIMVIKQLQLKFGALSRDQKEKIMHAKEAEIDRIIEQILSDATLEELLNFG